MESGKKHTRGTAESDKLGSRVSRDIKVLSDHRLTIKRDIMPNQTHERPIRLAVAVFTASRGSVPPFLVCAPLCSKVVHVCGACLPTCSYGPLSSKQQIRTYLVLALEKLSIIGA
jgi:hypothetical protein